ncbi:MAG: hypothetical protein AAF533_00570 [Acidobacteriota bacterium]
MGRSGDPASDHERTPSTDPAHATDRFTDSGAGGGTFGSEVWVLCPSCNVRGRVVRTSTGGRRPRFTCAHCLLRLEGYRSRWYGPATGVVQGRCGRCGRRLHRVLKGEQGLPDEAELSCADCEASHRVRVSWSFGPEGTAREPAFGLPLELQAPCCKHTLWAYNPRHLELLHGFVSARLRERGSDPGPGWASQLPTWIKRAENREAVLATIERLSRQAAASKR